MYRERTNMKKTKLPTSIVKWCRHFLQSSKYIKILLNWFCLFEIDIVRLYLYEKILKSF